MADNAHPFTTRTGSDGQRRVALTPTACTQPTSVTLRCRRGRALAHHQIDPGTVTTSTTLLAVRQDQLVPSANMRALAARPGGPAHLYEIDSNDGHDAFLTEERAVADFLHFALKGTCHEQQAS